jgi:hypothetical protein
MKKFEQVSNQICGSYTFNAAFDSGNLGKVEQVKTVASECKYYIYTECDINHIDLTKY